MKYIGMVPMYLEFSTSQWCVRDMHSVEAVL